MDEGDRVMRATGQTADRDGWGEGAGPARHPERSEDLSVGHRILLSRSLALLEMTAARSG
jgi:hypothetical protein